MDPPTWTSPLLADHFPALCIIAIIVVASGGCGTSAADRHSSGMVWPKQTPPATDVILHLNVPCAGAGPDKLTYLEIDKLPDGTYRATVGTLFEHEEVCRTTDLEALVRHANAMAGCRSFNDIVNAFRAMRALGLRPPPR